MRTLPRVVILCTILAHSNLCWAAPAAPPEASYRGKTLKEWVKASRSGDDRIRQQAAWALGLGPFNEKAVPTLIDLLKDKNAKVRDAAISALAEIGKDAAPAVPHVEALLDKVDENLSRHVCWALSSMSRAGAQALVRASKHDVREIKEKAAWAMRNLDPEGAKEAAPSLLEALNNYRNEGRGLGQGGFDSFAAMAPIADTVIPKLLKYLEDQDKDIRHRAIQAISALGPAGKPAIPDLVKALQDSEWKVRLAAAQALDRVVSDFDESIAKALIEAMKEEPSFVALHIGAVMWRPSARPALLKAIVSDNPRVRVGAARSLRHFFWDHDESYSALVNALKDPDPTLRSEALFSLGPFLSDGAPCSSSILELAKDPNKNVRDSVARCLPFNEFATEKVIEALANLLEDQEIQIRQEAMRKLESISKAKPKRVLSVRDKLIRSLEGKDLNTRQLAIRISGALTEYDEQFLGAVIVALADEQEGAATTAAETLGELGRKGKAAEPALKVALGDSRISVRLEAALALEKINPGNPLSLPILMDPLKSGDSEEVAIAASFIGRMGSHAKKAIPLLITRLEKTSQTEECGTYIEALQAMGPDAREAVGALAKVFEGDSINGKYFAFQALVAIGEPATPALIDQLYVPESRVQAAEALKQLGSKAKDAAPALKELLHDRNPKARRAAAAALAAIGKGANVAKRDLQEAGEDSDKLVQVEAACALWKCNLDKAALEKLKFLAADKDFDVRLSATLALWQTDYQEDAKLLFEQIFKNAENEPGLFGAVQALDNLQPPPRKLVPALLPLLKVKSPLRLRVRSLIRKLDPMALQ